MSIGLTDLPADAVRDILDLLDDKNLLPVLHVSRASRILGLVTLLMRHKSLANLDSSTKVSFSSGYIGDLERNLNDITKLTVHYDSFPDFMTLARVCLSLPNLTELDLNIRYLRSSTRAKFSQNGLLYLIYALSERSDGISNLLVLDDGYWCMSKRRRQRAEILTPNPTGCCASVVWPAAISYLLLGTVARGLYTYLRDPFATRKQKDRLRKDMKTFMLRTPYQCSETLQLKFKPLAPSTFPSLIHENWNLVVFDGNKTTELTMGHGRHHQLLPRKDCGPALSSIHLPLLKSLHVCKKAKLSMTDVAPFLDRHPTIESLMLNHYSLSPPLTTPGMKWAVPNLAALEAPLHYLEGILRDIDIRRLSTICIGKRPQYRGNIIEKKFEFDVLDRVLETLTNSSATSLMIVLPGGLKSRAWLAGRSRSTGTERAETKMVMVQSLIILTEMDKPFHRNIAPPLRDWVHLFISINLFQCTVPRDWPSSMAKSEVFGVFCRFGYNGGRHNIIHNVPWRDCRSCGGAASLIYRA